MSAAAADSATLRGADTAKPPLRAWPGPIATRDDPPLVVREMSPTAIALAKAFPGLTGVLAEAAAKESATTPTEIAFDTASDTQSAQPVAALA